MFRSLLVFLLLAGAFTGCTRQVNPSFPLTQDQAANNLDEMRAAPKRLERPLVILGGFADTGLGTAVLRHRIGAAFDDPQLLVITFAGCTSFEQCRQRVVQAITDRWGWTHASRTAEVDLIGASMGGLVALVSAADFGDGAPRVNAKRIFTLSSPLQGALLANSSPLLLTEMQRDLKAGSSLYQRLKHARIDSELFCYTRLDDPIVGAQFASLDGQPVWWVDTPPLELSHVMGVIDDRILADVSRRLRGEPPYTQNPPAAIPAEIR